MTLSGQTNSSTADKHRDTGSAGWLGEDLSERPGLWRVEIPQRAGEELAGAAKAAVATGTALSLTAARPPGLEHAAAFAAELHARLGADGPGFAVVTGFPLDALEPDEIEHAYWLLGLLLGRPVSQSAKGDLIGRVEDLGADISSPVQRGYESSAALPFHADRTDVIGLLCVRPAGAGGLSRLVSSPAVHDLLHAEAPELLDELYRPLPNDRRGEEQPGEQPWSALPVFHGAGRHFAARYVRRFITASQRHPGAPRLSDRQLAAMDALDAVLDRPGVSLDMELHRGDLQLINNFRILHARSAFADTGDASRLLLRLWLAFSGSPRLPEHFAALYRATGEGAYRGGVWPAGGVPDHMGRPVAHIG